MVRFFTVFFVWICNKRGGFLSPCFPLDLFYCYRNFVSQNWPRKFVNQSRMADQSDGGRKFRQRPRPVHSLQPTCGTRCKRILAVRAARAAAACAPASSTRRVGLFLAYRQQQTRRWWRLSGEKGLNSGLYAGGGWGRKEREKDGFRVSMVSIIEVPMAP